MKKTLLFATALMFGTAAMAQDTGAQTPAANQPMSGPNASSPAPDTTMPATTDTPMAAPADSSAPMAPAPAASAPMASGSTAMASGSTAMASDPSTYPPCSKTVTDKCMSGSGGKKMAMAKHKGMKKKM